MTPDLLASTLAGFMAPIVVQFIKVRLAFKDFNAVTLTTGVSLVLGLAAAWMSGSLDSFGSIAEKAGFVFGLSTIVYNTLKASGLENKA